MKKPFVAEEMGKNILFIFILSLMVRIFGFSIVLVLVVALVWIFINVFLGGRYDVWKFRRKEKKRADKSSNGSHSEI